MAEPTDARRRCKFTHKWREPFGSFWAILGAAASERRIARVAGREVGRAALKGRGGGKGVGNGVI